MLSVSVAKLVWRHEFCRRAFPGLKRADAGWLALLSTLIPCAFLFTIIYDFKIFCIFYWIAADPDIPYSLGGFLLLYVSCDLVMSSFFLVSTHDNPTCKPNPYEIFLIDNACAVMYINCAIATNCARMHLWKRFFCHAIWSDAACYVLSRSSKGLALKDAMGVCR